MLDTLFVKLEIPSKTVNIPSLPENVVPVEKRTITTHCLLPLDNIVQLSREQVHVLLTDYTSQGCTRPYNTVELNVCITHQSYYTCLSCSASAEGTIIVQCFYPPKNSRMHI